MLSVIANRQRWHSCLIIILLVTHSLVQLILHLPLEIHIWISLARMDCLVIIYKYVLIFIRFEPSALASLMANAAHRLREISP